MKVAVQIDPLDKIIFESDSTISLIRESVKRGFETWYYYSSDMSLDNNKVVAQCTKITSLAEGSINTSDIKTMDLEGFNVILMRQDPPVNMRYLTSTYILEKISEEVVILNHPRSVRDCSEKLFPLTVFSKLMPPTLVAEDLKKAEDFLSVNHEIVIKPLYGYAGQDIFKETKEDFEKFQKDFQSILSNHQSPVMLQRFLPEVKVGDKRIILVEGEIAGAINRVPQDMSIKANMSAGGEARKTEITDRDREICNIVGPELKSRGIIFAGLDVIGDYLTEINVTSPTGIESMNNLYSLEKKSRIESQIWDALENRVSNIKK
jgi:glutathione synthase